MPRSKDVAGSPGDHGSGVQHGAPLHWLAHPSSHASGNSDWLLSAAAPKVRKIEKLQPTQTTPWQGLLAKLTLQRTQSTPERCCYPTLAQGPRTGNPEHS
ncbi:hypothetical protein D623_10003627 [Myotis brandtii]|uniref:Uncharacterized protein n=1 Tax=Myotis brandtii TaxID=109478 RepID=S7ND76_MYOBR|nr:hypothetical protein D623_10003627 [Myotis brandtii]